MSEMPISVRNCTLAPFPIRRCSRDAHVPPKNHPRTALVLLVCRSRPRGRSARRASNVPDFGRRLSDVGRPCSEFDQFPPLMCRAGAARVAAHMPATEARRDCPTSTLFDQILPGFDRSRPNAAKVGRIFTRCCPCSTKVVQTWPRQNSMSFDRTCAKFGPNQAKYGHIWYTDEVSAPFRKHTVDFGFRASE